MKITHLLPPSVSKGSRGFLFTTLSVSAFCVFALSPAQAAVIQFKSQEDLTANFSETGTPGSGNAWRYLASEGADGSTGRLYGDNSGWLIYDTPIDPTLPSLSSGIYFQYRNANWNSSTLSLTLGVTSDPDYNPSITTTGAAGQTHYAAILHLVRQTSPSVSYRTDLRAQAVNNGTPLANEVASPGVSLTHLGWYYLALESTFDADDQTYQLTVRLYSTHSDATLDSELLSTNIGPFSAPGLSGAEHNYLFFGVNGGSVSGKGIQNLDNFTVAIPEPPTAMILGIGLAAALCYKIPARFKKTLQ